MMSLTYSENKGKLDLCLVGKIIGNKLANRDGLESAMKNIWKSLEISRSSRLVQTTSFSSNSAIKKIDNMSLLEAHGCSLNNSSRLLSPPALARLPL
ncbi:hypothetical protein TorRG33x02_067670 [Trema orientale]|uniref:Uncharacterized protein n=1 Tax=Trema orientale TaxID=63057 RepID=A0A2P5FID1_TREOI|nr:hypothetical protein TorRG33x02_067670 [Trema orientale]